MHIAAMMVACPLMTFAQQTGSESKVDYTPQVHGTVRGKYEYEPEIEKGRFEVRNARLSVEGKVAPIVSYKAEVDLCDEGEIKMLDAYARITPIKGLKFTIGQMRVPFTIDAHRAPHLQYFANRSFLAKQVGNVRDVGAAVGYSFGSVVPVTLEGGIFNGSGLKDQKDFWTDSYNFSAKASAMFFDQINLTLSAQRAFTGTTRVMMYDAGAYWQRGRWHVESEFLRKFYDRDAFKPVNAIDAFAAYRLPMSDLCKTPGAISAMSFLGRYDYMSDHSKGKANADGVLPVDDPARHRITGGVTLHLGGKKLLCDVRLNYEKYLYANDVVSKISERDKAVVEVMVRF